MELRRPVLVTLCYSQEQMKVNTSFGEDIGDPGSSGGSGAIMTCRCFLLLGSKKGIQPMEMHNVVVNVQPMYNFFYVITLAFHEL